MSDLWAVVGTLGGAIIGWVSAANIKNAEWKRQQSVRWDAVRREIYGSFLGRCNEYFQSLCTVARRLRSADKDGARIAYKEANALRSQVAALKGEVDIINSESVRTPANNLYGYLEKLNTDLHNANRALNKDQQYPAKTYDHTRENIC
jgi:hypothetical protein